MARQELGNERTTIVVEGSEMVMERVFDAPRELVWAALTSPEHIPQWWGPHGTISIVDEMEVRPGGRWRLRSDAKPDGSGGFPFKGEFLEVVPPERLVRTSAPDMEPAGPPAVETITLEDVDGRTRMRHHARFPSEEVLEYALSTGMTHGILEQFDRLADLLPEMA